MSRLFSAALLLIFGVYLPYAFVPSFRTHGSLRKSRAQRRRCTSGILVNKHFAPRLLQRRTFPSNLQAMHGAENSSDNNKSNSQRRRPRDLSAVSEDDRPGQASEENRPLFSTPSDQERARFKNIMDDILKAETQEELPSLLTQHVSFLLSVDVTEMTNELIRQQPTLDGAGTLRNAYDFLVEFLESMVESTLDIQKENRAILKEIIEVAKIGAEEFDEKMSSLKERFSYEFVKYLDGEVDRLEKAGGGELLNIIKIIRTRVCAEVDLMLGEDVASLTRLLSYTDRYMMRSALRAVLDGKSVEAFQSFKNLVENTLKDVRGRKEADPVLRSKLADIANDLDIIFKETAAAG